MDGLQWLPTIVSWWQHGFFPGLSGMPLSQTGFLATLWVRSMDVGATCVLRPHSATRGAVWLQTRNLRVASPDRK